MTATFNLLLGDCLERLKELPDNSIDSIVTDPPYGLSKQPDMVEVLTHWMAGEDYKHNSKGFMGKEWDSFVPGPSIWKECMRVLKPGGHMVAFFGTRTYDIGVLAIRLAGFEIRNQLSWVFGSGFPKSLDVSKAIDATVATGKSSSKALSQTEKTDQ
jgi:DNA modification methylase